MPVSTDIPNAAITEYIGTLAGRGEKVATSTLMSPPTSMPTTPPTNVSVAAVSGLEGATDGIRAVENRSIAGKIIVYPACRGLGLVQLEEMSKKMPEVAECLNDGLWTLQAERRLLERFAR